MLAQKRHIPLMFGLMACLFSPCSIKLWAAEDKQAKAERDPSSAATEYRRPVLAALSWQHLDRSKAREVQSAWRPDGEQIDAEEAKWLHNEVHNFDGRTHGPGVLLRSLILIFRIDERSRSPQRLKATVITNGNRFDQTGLEETGRTFLSKSEVTMPTSLLGKWPEEIDVEVRVPVAEPALFKRIESLPDRPIELDRGVGWYVDPAGGAEFRSKRTENEPQGTAFILQVDRAEADSQVEYTYQFRLKDKDFRMRTFTVRGEKETDVKQIISKDHSIEFVDFYKQPYRMHRYEKVRLRTDLMPD